MAGHSKWAQIKRKKAATDSKRGKLFSKIVKEIAIAARIGGADPTGNPRLRTAIDKAKEYNMPADNIKRAVQKGSGDMQGVVYEEIAYEGYGQGGAAILIEVLTDNKNRTAAEVRSTLSKHGGSLGDAGCVSWMFDKRGYILVDKNDAEEESLMEIALEAGALDLKNDPREDFMEIVTNIEDMQAVKERIEKSSIKITSAEITMIPQNYVSLDAKKTSQVMRLVDLLEENDDVQNVYTNIDVTDEVLKELE